MAQIIIEYCCDNRVNMSLYFFKYNNTDVDLDKTVRELYESNKTNKSNTPENEINDSKNNVQIDEINKNESNESINLDIYVIEKTCCQRHKIKILIVIGFLMVSIPSTVISIIVIFKKKSKNNKIVSSSKYAYMNYSINNTSKISEQKNNMRKEAIQINEFLYDFINDISKTEICKIGYKLINEKCRPDFFIKVVYLTKQKEEKIELFKDYSDILHIFIEGKKIKPSNTKYLFKDEGYHIV